MKSVKNFMKVAVVLGLLVFGSSVLARPTAAQEGNRQQQGTFVYTVQPGDTLNAIARRFNLLPTEIALANRLSNVNLLFPGQQLVLPAVSRQVTAAPPALSPGRVDQTHTVQPGETLFTIAAAYGVSLETIILTNHLANPDLLQVGQTLQIPGTIPPTPETLAAPFAAVELSEPTIIQGRTLVIRVKLATTATLSGDFEGRPILFRDSGNGQFWGIAAIHAMTEPNVYPIKITANLPNGSQVTLLKEVRVVEGPYGQENIQVDPERGGLLDPELIRVEQEKLDNLWSQVSPQPYWQGAFWYPVGLDSLRVTSNFGTRRNYNGGSELTFHAGTDFGGDVGKPIYAPAAGKIVLAEKLAVRGNAVLLDHGLGLFSGYWHQSQLIVAVGQEVKQGQLIGFIGDTGLATGAHLHWEMRLNGIAVEPLQWVQQSIP
ncbi:MAG: LysM peptidoglycan-binding domain-containing M23 family metallopeptidase [Anaerolineae bacterium]|nr:LysM peptidoglycan-binding domain-containing M23 family metallopeptidase [Anaerolineae bacterium]